MERRQQHVRFEQFAEQIVEDVCRQQIQDIVQKPCEQQVQQIQEQKPCEQPQQAQEQKPCEQVQQIQEQKPCEQVQQIQEQKPCEQIQQIQKQEPCEQVQQIQEQKPCEQVQQVQEQKPCEQAQQIQEQEPCEQAQQVQEQKPCEQAQQIQEQKPCEQVQKIQEQKPCEQAQQVQEQKPCEQVQQIQEQKPCEQAQQIQEQELCEQAQEIQEQEPCEQAQQVQEQKPCEHAQEPCKQEEAPCDQQQEAAPCKEPELAPVKQEPCVDQEKAPIKQEPCAEPEKAPMKQEAEPCKKKEKAPIKEQVPCKQEQAEPAKCEKGKSCGQKAEKIVESPVKMGQNIPTIVPFQPFNPRADADVLYKAMKGLGTNEKALIDVLCHRTCDQRVQIVQIFKQAHGKDLIAFIKKETTGHLERVLVALCQSRANFLASEIDCAFKSAKSDDVAVAEILCTQSHADILAIKASYQQLFGRPLEVDIEKRIPGGLQMLLLSLLKSPELAQVNYDVDPELVAIVKCAEKRAAFLAKRLHDAMKGLGTKDRILIRLIVSRCDVDLGNIKIAFENIYGKSLASCVARDVSFNYKKTLLTLVG